ncbi:hypothetical protein I8752_33315 [Nostocaceae cyanobacterium CENA369]|uniref:Uncharacterized protein n=1 Tax=Dendronalium phyllosphericum CENA369 TaxID=1725256 RepID=A0A8J7IJU9_9NOST|nr:hypothetical protein [Dendronalium phyllosphericum]MBH8577761.1 hypothetical protein [Dendronalium phyllosphericum CENA369]
MNYCHCCSGLLLAHLRRSEVVWFCRHCWQDMPVFTRQKIKLSNPVYDREIV